MYGRDPLGTNELEEHTVHDPTSYEKYLSKKLAALRDFVECHNIEEQSRQKEYYDERSHISNMSNFLDW